MVVGSEGRGGEKGGEERGGGGEKGGKERGRERNWVDRVSR